MRCRVLGAMVCILVAVVVLATQTAQAATTVAYWKFDEKTPGNVVDFTTGAIQDDTTAHNGTAYGGDPFNDPDVNVYSRYVDGATGSGDSALRMTLQDWPAESSYVEVEEDVIFAPASSAFNIDVTSNTVYTIEAIVRAPDPMDIMDSDLYHGLREGFDTFPQWYDYTSNSIVGRPSSGTTPCWVLRLQGGHVQMYMYDGTAAPNYIAATSNRIVTGGLWHQVAAKITGGASRKVELYIDGVKDSEASLADLTASIASSNTLMLGSWQDTVGERWSDEFVGDIDSVRISTGTDVTFLTAPTQTVPTLNLGHTGKVDPTTEAHLKLVDGSDTGAPTATGTAITGVGGAPDSWRLQEIGHDNYMSNSYAYYRGLLAPEQLEDPSGWTLTATMKLGVSNKPWNECMAVEDGTTSWVMSFMDSTYTDDGNNPGAAGAGVYKSGAYDFTGGSITSHFTGVTKMGTTDPTTGFHKYQMYYDPATDKVSFYVDGNYVGEQTRAEAWDREEDGGFANKCRFFFGDSYPVYYHRNYFPGDTASDAYWSDIKLETGNQVKGLVYMPYDVNEDGFIGADDLDIVRAHWGESGTGGKAIGDINLDEFVGADDLDQLRAHWGESYTPVPGLVPEPSAFVLLAMGGLILLIRRRTH